MIKIEVMDKEVKRLLAGLPKAATRAAEQTIDQVTYLTYKAEKAEIVRAFKDPVPYTKNSLKYTKTKNHNLLGEVWFKDPERMADHYLLPEVEGGERKLKGFEHAIGKKKFIPSKHLGLDRYGNVSAGLIRQILGVLGKAELTAGYQGNVTKKSAVRNTKHRDYVYLPRGSRRGKLPPGIYLRVADKFKGFNSPATRRKLASTYGHSEMQLGRRKVAIRDSRGRIVRWVEPKSKIQSIVRARGLRPVLIVGRQHGKYTPRLKFYEIANKVHADNFRTIFFARFNSLVGKR